MYAYSVRSNNVSLVVRRCKNSSTSFHSRAFLFVDEGAISSREDGRESTYVAGVDAASKAALLLDFLGHGDVVLWC